MEKWRDIEGYEGLYQVSDKGRVKSLPKMVSYPIGNKEFTKVPRGELIMSLSTTSRGYKQVGLHKDGKSKRVGVHRLVAKAFIPNPDDLPQVNHKDENPSNNDASNLEWCSAKYNANYGTARERIKATKAKNKRKRELEQAKNVRPDDDCADATLWDTYMGEKHGAWYVEYAKECIPEPEMRIKMWKIFDSVDNG